jgi:hypothetical protein
MNPFEEARQRLQDATYDPPVTSAPAPADIDVEKIKAAADAITTRSVKAVQAQLGHLSEQSTHKYSHLGSGAQKRLVEALQPALAPHERGRHFNLVSTAASSSFDEAS